MLARRQRWLREEDRNTARQGKMRQKNWLISRGDAPQRLLKCAGSLLNKLGKNRN